MGPRRSKSGSEPSRSRCNSDSPSKGAVRRIMTALKNVKSSTDPVSWGEFWCRISLFWSCGVCPFYTPWVIDGLAAAPEDDSASPVTPVVDVVKYFQTWQKNVGSKATPEPGRMRSSSSFSFMNEMGTELKYQSFTVLLPVRLQHWFQFPLSTVCCV